MMSHSIFIEFMWAKMEVFEVILHLFVFSVKIQNAKKKMELARNIV